MGLHRVTCWVRSSVSDLPGRCGLRSPSTDRLVVPPFKLSAIGSRTFKVTADQTCMELSDDIVTTLSKLYFATNLFH